LPFPFPPIPAKREHYRHSAQAAIIVSSAADHHQHPSTATPTAIVRHCSSSRQSLRRTSSGRRAAAHANAIRKASLLLVRKMSRPITSDPFQVVRES
jgi:hypothetical protein